MLSHWNYVLLASVVKKTTPSPQASSAFLPQAHASRQNTLCSITRKSSEYFGSPVVPYFVPLQLCYYRPLPPCPLIVAYQIYNSVCLLRKHKITVLIFILQKKTRYRKDTVPAGPVDSGRNPACVSMAST